MLMLSCIGLLRSSLKLSATNSARKAHQYVYSSSIIQITKDDTASRSDPKQQDYRVCYITRGKQMKSFAGVAAYPGGQLDAHDLDASIWGQVFKEEDLIRLRKRFATECRLPVYTAQPKGCLLPEVALRVCAIRELFEETGILLARGKSGSTKGLTGLELTKKLPSTEVSKWRSSINRNAALFARFCHELELEPAVDELIEWSVWLQPAMGGKRRFHAVFYMHFSEQEPSQFSFAPVQGDSQQAGSHASAEVQRVDWWTPNDTRALVMRGEIGIAPPQIYELSRLFNDKAQRFDAFRQWTFQRERFGFSSMSSQLTKFQDGYLITWLGDERNKEEISRLNDIPSVSEGLDSVRADTIRNRMYIRNGTAELSVNIGRNGHDAPFGHVYPDDRLFKSCPVVLKVH